jgi:hypothetical protein
MNIDLHIHSSYSDGAYTPSELISMAAQLGVKVIAIADHDSVSGVTDAVSCGQDYGIEVIPAVELSVQFDSFRDVHLLGYGINCSDEAFLGRIIEFRKRREQRNNEIVELVNRQLIAEGREAITIDEVLAFARDAIGRPHIARVLLERKYVSSLEDAFQRYLVPCNIPKSYWDMDNAIDEIHRIGGVAVLAHPTSISKDLQELKCIVLKLKNMGLDGIEVFNNMGWPQEIEFLRRLAIELDLLVTAGSDFHGIEYGMEIGKGREGICFDSSLLAPLNTRIQEQQSRTNQNR